MKIKYKFITILLLIILSFSSLSFHTEKKANAFVIESYLLFQAGVSFMAFTGFASFVAVNGYHMQLSDLAVSFANKYYDYSNGVYTAKAEKINVLDKLNLYISGALTGNLENIPTLEELQIVRDSIVEDFPQFVDPTTLTPSYTQTTTYMDKRFPYWASGDYKSESGIYTHVGAYKNINEKFAGKIIKINIHSYYPNAYYYIDFNNYGWVDINGSFYPSLLLISAIGEVKKIVLSGYNIQLGAKSYNNSNKIIDVAYDVSTSGSGGTVIANLHAADYQIVRDYATTPDTFSSAARDFVNAFPNFYGALNGKAKDTVDLENLMNTDEYLQREITALLQKQAVNEPNTLIEPALNPDGTIYYPGTQTDNPDIPDNPPYTPTETWYNNLYGWLVGMPDKIAEKVADIPILGDIVGGITDLVGRVTDIWDWLRTGLLGILQSILNAILDILAFLVGLPALLIQLLKDALIWLFVPDATFFNGKLEEFKLNFAFIETFTAFIQRLEDMTSSNAVPTVSVDLSKFRGSFGGRSISMGAEAYILDMRWYLPFKAMGDLMFTAFVYVMFIWRFFGRLPEIISGGGLLYTADSKTDDLVRKLEGKKK